MVPPLGARKMLARTPAPWTSRTRPFSGVDGDDLAEPPERVVLEMAAELVGERVHRVAQLLEIGLRRAVLRPVDVEQAVAQVHPTLGDVAAHSEQRQQPGRSPSVSEERR